MVDLKATLITLIIGVGVVDDLLTKKVHNVLALVSALVCAAFSFYIGGMDMLTKGSISLVILFICLLPLFKFKVLGGGDVKLILALSLLMSWNEALSFVVFSFLWGTIFGLLVVILKRQHVQFVFNFLQMISRFKAQPNTPVQTQKIPFTVAMLFGWLTQVTLTSQGRAFI